MDEINKYSYKDHKENDDVELQAEVEHLKQHLSERDAHILALESEFVNCTAKNTDLEEQVNTWREKYERLYDSHKRVQKLNQVLEEKLLQMVDKMKNEKSQLTKDIATISVRLAESKHNYGMLQKENERYKNDMNLAIQLLQCKPDNFVSHKLDNLPVDTQARVSQYVMSKSKPSILSNNKNGNENDTFDASEYEFNISASLMTKILEDSIQDTVTKHCDTCTCSSTQAKPFSYNETSYSVATQTPTTGDMKHSLCLNCNSDIKSVNSNLSNRSSSPHGIKIINDKTSASLMPGPMYIIPQPVVDNIHSPNCNNHVKDTTLFDNTISTDHQKDVMPMMSNSMLLRKSTSMQMEPGVHHKLCDRTRSVSSKISCNNSINNEDLIMKDTNQTKENTKIENFPATSRMRENSQSSNGAISRTSSIAKSSTSTHKSNTAVGPGPRFCSLRVQAGSKNILLDNAQPDVPPVLYRRQSRCNNNTLFNDMADAAENFQTEENANKDEKNNSVVVESTLIDVHVDNNIKDNANVVNETSINPVLLNVSSSPLQPLKTHNFTNHVEPNKSETIDSKPNVSEVDKLLEGINLPVDKENETIQCKEGNAISNKLDMNPKVEEDKGIKLFNFDRYEQSSIPNKFNNPYRKIDMAKFHTLENTKLSKDLPPLGDEPNVALTKDTVPKPGQIVNVYSNLAQTHLKVNDSNKLFEKSTSSLSSDDSAAILQKQQLLRVAEWVEQNLEQQNVFNDPSMAEDEAAFNKTKRERLDRLAESFTTLALNMPHPVSKYAKPRGDANCKETAGNSSHNRGVNVSKETIFPVECDENESSVVGKTFDEVCAGVANDISQALAFNGEKDITTEDLARMEYNVKQFLLSGPQWVNTNYVHRSRRTSSKTETDV